MFTVWCHIRRSRNYFGNQSSRRCNFEWPRGIEQILLRARRIVGSSPTDQGSQKDDHRTKIKINQHRIRQQVSIQHRLGINENNEKISRVISEENRVLRNLAEIAESSVWYYRRRKSVINIYNNNYK